MFAKLFGRKKKVVSAEQVLAARHRIDLDLCYCPQCAGEYQAGITQCVDCRVTLIAGREKLARLGLASPPGRPREIGPADPLTTVQGGKLRDLKAMHLILARHGIPARISGEAGSCAKG